MYVGGCVHMWVQTHERHQIPLGGVAGSYEFPDLDARYQACLLNKNST